MKSDFSRLIQDYAALTKPRITAMILVTCAIGFILGGGGVVSWPLFLVTLLGTALTSAGSAVLNNYIERDVDQLMERTRNRPLPAGRVTPPNALAFGVILVLSGVLLLEFSVNLLTAFLAILTAFLYCVVYTPMKRVSWLNTLIGAIPGALPPVGGWAAATGEVGIGAWALFAILFVWQHPHFYAIAWMCRDDYRRGGFKMLSVIEPDGQSTFRQILWFSLVLIPVSLIPAFIGLAGVAYACGALALGLYMLRPGLTLRRSGAPHDARAVLRRSVVYLPLLLILILADSAL